MPGSCVPQCMSQSSHVLPRPHPVSATFRQIYFFPGKRLEQTTGQIHCHAAPLAACTPIRLSHQSNSCEVKAKQTVHVAQPENPAHRELVIPAKVTLGIHELSTGLSCQSDTYNLEAFGHQISYLSFMIRSGKIEVVSILRAPKNPRSHAPGPC